MRKEKILNTIADQRDKAKAYIEKERETLNNNWLYMDEVEIRLDYGNIRALEGEIIAYERAIELLEAE